MPDPERIRRAAALRKPPEPPPSEGKRLDRSPIDELRRLAVSANSESARIQALRLLLERMDLQREREAEQAREEAERRARERPATPADEWDRSTLRREWDEWTAMEASDAIQAVFFASRDPERLPEGARHLDERMKADAERYLAEHPRMARVIRQGIEQRARELVESDWRWA
jgi:hypothetical protein